MSFDTDGGDEFPFKPTGLEISGSYALNENVFFLGSYASRSDELNMGFGSISDEFSDVTFEITMTELKLGAGFKRQLSDKFEVFGQAGLWYALDSDSGDDTETEFKFGAKYQFYKNFSASASYSMMDDTNIMNVGITYYLN